MTEQLNSSKGSTLILILVFGFSFALSAYGQTKTSQSSDEKPIQIATYNSKSRKVENIRKERLKSAFEDGMQVDDVRVEKQGNQFYLIREGKSENARRISRTLLTLSGDGALFIQTGGTTETCTAESCTRCEFAKGGGCFCSSPGSCKYTKSKSTGGIVNNAN